MLSDVRHAIRLLVRNPGFAAVVCLTLALGIGGSTAIFSVVAAVLLKPLPYPHADRLVMLETTSPAGTRPIDWPRRFDALQRQTEAFEAAAAFRLDEATLTDSDPESVVSEHVSAGFLALFGAPLAAGRVFTKAEYEPGRDSAVILSDGLWQRRFGGDRNVLGKTLSVNGVPYVIVGVLGQDFDFRPLAGSWSPDVWLPLPLDSSLDSQGHYLDGVARLREGITLAMANRQASLAADDVRREFPRDLGPQASFGVERLQDVVVRDVRPSLLILVGAVGLVLLLACANVANVLLVRATARQREMAVRLAIGASRPRIIRLLLAEGVVLSTIGGTLGVLAGSLALHVLLAMSPVDIPRIGLHGSAVTIDWRVVTFAALVCLGTSLMFGLLPWVPASRTGIAKALTTRDRTQGRSGGRAGFRALLVVGEVCFALVLLVGSGLLLRTFIALRSVNPGFDPHQVLALPMPLNGVRFDSTTGLAELVRSGLERLRAEPGVVAASAGCCVPMLGRYSQSFDVVGRPTDESSSGTAGWVNVSPGYFDVFRIPVVEGRSFSDRDDGHAVGVVVINRTMARRFWGNSSPLHDRVIIGKGFPGADEPARQIIGVVGDVPDGGLNHDPLPMMYVPTAQVPNGLTAAHARVPMTWMVRTRSRPQALSNAIQAALRDATGGLPVDRAGVRLVDEFVRESTATETFDALLMTVFGGVALLLAMIGVYGVMASVVQQRTREIGIRLALGAAPNHMRNMILWQGLWLSLSGIGIGLGAAAGLSRVLTSLLFGVTPREPIVFAASAIVLVTVALGASWLPARRATRVDPVMALRAE
jgi:putative ABC transport system permease protein